MHHPEEKTKKMFVRPEISLTLIPSWKKEKRGGGAGGLQIPDCSPGHQAEVKSNTEAEYKKGQSRKLELLK